MRLIDADALLDSVKIQMLDEDYDITCVISDIENAPTIDAVEVVHCKDCVFSQGFAWYACPMAGKVNPKNNDFCSRGERRTDATD